MFSVLDFFGWRGGPVILPLRAIENNGTKDHRKSGRTEFRKFFRKYHLDPAAWVLPGEVNAMKNLVHCNYGLAKMSGEVNVRFIALLSPFDRTQGPVYLGKKVSQVTGTITSIQQRGRFQVR